MRNRIKLALPGLLLALSLSIFPRSTTPANANLPRPIAANAYDLLDAVNALRVNNGLAPYNMHPILMQIAQAHAAYMASIGAVTHYSADGSRPYRRALAAGYPVAGDLSRGGFFSENIMGGPNLTPAEVVSAWQGDYDHLNTMLSPNLFDAGAGVAVSGDMVYYVLDAGRASGSSVAYTPPADGAPATSEYIQPVVTSTAGEDGSIRHEVQSGQALWSIAIAYGTTVDQIKLLNNLISNDIYPGQMLLIVRGATATPATPTTTPRPATATPTRAATRTPTLSPTPEPIPLTQTNSGAAVVIGIIIFALGAAALGAWLSNKKPV